MVRKGTGGLGARALRGRGPTPRAEDRPYHPAAKRKLHSLSPAAKSFTNGVIAGINPVLEALRSGLPVKSLLVVAGPASPRREEILSLAKDSGVAVREVSRSELGRLCDRHQGVAVKPKPYRYLSSSELLERIRLEKVPLVLACDGLTDPRNLGAIVRSALGLGAAGVMVPKRRSVGVTPVVWRTSAGSLARLPLAQASNLTRAIEEYKQAGFFVAGLDGKAPRQISQTYLAKEPLVLVIGSEGRGIGELVKKQCDELLSIPATRVESLNAAVAAGIALYEIARLRA